MKKSLIFLIIIHGVLFANIPRFIDLGNGVIKDNATGLFWQKCSAGQTGNDCSGTADTKDWTTAKDYCTNLILGGKKWRLPEITELLTLVDYTRSLAPTINPIFSNTEEELYWSNTVYAGGPSSSWGVDFNNGNSNDDNQANTSWVRCVAP